MTVLPDHIEWCEHVLRAAVDIQHRSGALHGCKWSRSRGILPRRLTGSWNWWTQHTASTGGSILLWYWQLPSGTGIGMVITLQYFTFYAPRLARVWPSCNFSGLFFPLLWVHSLIFGAKYIPTRENYLTDFLSCLDRLWRLSSHANYSSTWMSARYKMEPS